MGGIKLNITTSQILPPPSLDGEAHFSHVTWADKGQKFAVTWFNRVQNESVITLCDVGDLDCSSHEIFKRVSKNNYGTVANATAFITYLSLVIFFAVVYGF